MTEVAKEPRRTIPEQTAQNHPVTPLRRADVESDYGPSV